MDGQGRCPDNVFVERLWRTVMYGGGFVRGYRDVPELRRGLGAYFPFYNGERRHQSLDYRTPPEVYRAGRRPGGSGRPLPPRPPLSPLVKWTPGREGRSEDFCHWQ